MLDSCEELRQRLSATSRIADPTDKKAARQALAADYIPRWAQGIERLIGHGPFVGGAQPAVADIKIHMIEKALSGGAYDDIPTTVLEPYARLKAVARGIAKHPAVVAWYSPKS